MHSESASGEPLIANPIGWAHVKLAGGWRRILGVVGVYLGAAIFFHVLVYRGLRPSDLDLPSFCAGALVVMTYLQAAIIFLVGTGTIKRAIQRDFTSDMISSHRQSAMTGYTAVFGYLTGPNAQTFLLIFVNWAICTVLALLAGPKLGVSPVVPSLLLPIFGCMAAMYWTFAVLVGLSTQGKVSVIALVVLVNILSSSGVIDIAPGLALLIGAPAVRSFSATASGVSPDVSIVISTAAQIAFALIFYQAASKRYARDDCLAFDPKLSHIVLCLSALLTAVGLAYFPVGSRLGGPPVLYDLEMQCIASMVALALVGLLPVANAAKLCARWGRRRAKDPDYPGRRPRSHVEACFWATFFTFGILAACIAMVAEELTGRADQVAQLSFLAKAAAFYFFALLTVSGILRFVYAYTEKAIWALVIYLVVIWVLLPFTDLALEVATDRLPGEPWSALMACSPAGGWIVLFKDPNAPLIPGLVFQGVLAFATQLLARRARY